MSNPMLHAPVRTPAVSGVGRVRAIGGVLPARAGIGLKPQHFRDVLDTHPDVGFFEVHAENYMVDGGPFHHFLTRIRDHCPLSLHGVGLSIGAEGPIDEAHLDRLKGLINRYEPASFSEHLAWSSHGEHFFNDLLPVPYDQATLAPMCEHIDRVQERLQRRMLLENPSTYIEFEASSGVARPAERGHPLSSQPCAADRAARHRPGPPLRPPLAKVSLPGDGMFSARDAFKGTRPRHRARWRGAGGRQILPGDPAISELFRDLSRLTNDFWRGPRHRWRIGLHVAADSTHNPVEAP